MRMTRKPKAPPYLPVGSFLTLLFIAMMATTAVSDTIPLDEKGLPLWEVRVYNDFPVRFEVGSFDELEQLLERAPIASFNREQVRVIWDDPKNYHVTVETRVTEKESAALTNAGVSFEIVYDAEQEVRRAMESAWARQAQEKGDLLKYGEKGVYHTHTQIGSILLQVETDHSAIANRFNIGFSVLGRELWGIKISDNVNGEEAEPEVRLSGTMHGNEPVPQEMLLYLADYLTDNYGTDPDVTYLVDNYEINILPCHNPDGMTAGTRSNDNGVDLNRNFPVPDGSIGGDGTWSEEVETVAFKNWGFNRNFVISENGHTGALVVNYPWDYTYTLTPDDDAIIELSLEYSTYNVPMYNGAFSQGITNGAQWYIVYGSLQDWSYQETGCIDVTIEYSNDFQPPAGDLDSLWEDDNRESFMHFIKAARYGVNGIVTGSDTGLPLDATITVAGNSKSVYTDTDFGDYYKLLDTGSYDITFSATGYIPETHYGVSTTWGSPTVLNVDLDPLASGDVSGNVREVGTNNGLEADIEVRTYPGDAYVTTVQSDAGSDGYYTVNLIYGDYMFLVTCDGHSSDSRQLSVSSPSQTEDFLLGVVEEAILFEDDFEAGTSKWTGGWGLSSTSHSPSNSMTDSPSGEYANRDTTYCTMASSVNLMDAEQCSLAFWARWDIENDWDCVRLEVSTDGGTNWDAVATPYTVSASGQGTQKPSGTPIFEGTQTTWVENRISLASWQAETDVRFRFVLMSDTSVNEDGFYFDDFIIDGVQVATGVAAGAPGRTRLIGNFPNPFNPVTTIRFELAADKRVSLDVYDVSGRLIRKLLVSEPMGSGVQNVLWNGRSDSGQPVASGVYFYRLDAGGERAVRKMTLVR